jgi:hypothetical protein
MLQDFTLESKLEAIIQKFNLSLIDLILPTMKTWRNQLRKAPFVQLDSNLMIIGIELRFLILSAKVNSRCSSLILETLTLSMEVLVNSKNCPKISYNMSLKQKKHP